MNDQSQSMDDSVAWDDWLQTEQPFWACELDPESLALEPIGDVSTPPHTGVTSNVPQTFYDEPRIMGSELLSPLWISSHNAQAGEHSDQEFFAVIQSGTPSAPLEEARSLPILNLRSIYTKSTCASCNGPLDEQVKLLDIQDLYCIRSRAATHRAIACEECGEKFETIEALKAHSRDSHHRTFACAVPGCEIRLDSHKYFGLGEADHFAKVHPEIKYGCAQCGLRCDTHETLGDHGTEEMHTAYACRFPGCGSGAARLPDLLRHQLTHLTNVPRHPCPHCRRHRGNNGFKRKDHLWQHIRNYHHIEDGESQSGPLTFDCPREGCDRSGMNAFENKKLLQLHLRKDHDSPFQCPQPGCDRVGTRGWMRETDMVKHVKKVHGVLWVSQ